MWFATQAVETNQLLSVIYCTNLSSTSCFFMDFNFQEIKVCFEFLEIFSTPDSLPMFFSAQPLAALALAYAKNGFFFTSMWAVGRIN